jgi:hypothetical protein
MSLVFEHCCYIFLPHPPFLAFPGPLQGMLPLARELLKRGTEVVLAANTLPSINDITAAELKPLLAAAAEVDNIIRRAAVEQTLRVVESGNDMPVIDLRRVSGVAIRLGCRTLGSGGERIQNLQSLNWRWSSLQNAPCLYVIRTNAVQGVHCSKYCEFASICHGLSTGSMVAH